MLGARSGPHWIGPVELVWRARGALRRRDGGSVLRRITNGATTATGLRIRGQHTLILLDPAHAGELLVDLAPSTTKGPGLQLTRPLLGNGLLTSEGEEHRRVRRLVAPAFSPKRLAGYVDTFAGRTEAMLERWSDGATVDVYDEMGALTLDIVGQTLLGLDLSADTTGIRSALEAGLTAFAQIGFPLTPRRGVPADLTRLAPPELDAVHRVVDEIIETRRGSTLGDRGDVVSALLAAAAEPRGLTPQEVHDNVVTLLMAGHETTANALAWTFHLLGRHRDVERALRAEVDGLGGRAVTSEDLPRLTYTRAVVSESIRLFPPAWVMGRTVTSDARFGEWRVPAGSTVAVSPLLMQHDERWFPEPERFDPQRWLDERKDTVPRYAYIPFGTGPRSCIGEQFAWMEAVTVLATVAARVALRPVTGHTVTPQFRVTLRPGNGMPMTVVRNTE
ncbi:MAG TPA: cytochrome P450 [Actinomycetes bacterium]|nr:cytochrome P450 [Actinomycetes bacterium]